MTAPNKPKLSAVLSGIAGEYFVAAELTRRGFIASITLRNTRGIDVLVAAEAGGRAIGVQVKTSQYEKWWLLNKKCETATDPDLFYVFVQLKGETERPEFHVVPSDIVARETTLGHQMYLATPGRGGRARKDTDMREFHDEQNRYLERWDLLGLDALSQPDHKATGGRP